MRTSTTMLCTLLLLVSATLAQAQESKTTDKPADRHPWMAWKVGSYTTVNVIQQMGERKMQAARKIELTKVDDKNYTLKITMTLPNGQTRDQTQTKGLTDSPNTHPGRKKVGTEKLTIGGKEYDCTVYSVSWGEGMGKRDSKLWEAKGLDWPVKQETKNAQVTATQILEKTDAKVKVGDKELTCYVWKTTFKTAQGNGNGTVYMSRDLPGGLVKMEMTFDTPQGKMTQQMVATGFSGTRRSK